MMIDRDIPFFSNTPDDTHCQQAVLRMVVKRFWPKEDYTWEELDKISAKPVDKWTWPMASLIWLADRGVEIKDVETFDYEDFKNRGGDYLADFYGDETAKIQIAHSDIEQERKLVDEFIQKVVVDKRTPTTSEIKELLEDDYLVWCNVNARALVGKQGYSAHLVLIKGYEENELILHDPGIPPRENVRVSEETFETAWAWPNENAKSLVALKYGG